MMRGWLPVRREVSRDQGSDSRRRVHGLHPAAASPSACPSARAPRTRSSTSPFLPYLVGPPARARGDRATEGVLARLHSSTEAPGSAVGRDSLLRGAIDASPAWLQDSSSPHIGERTVLPGPPNASPALRGRKGGFAPPSSVEIRRCAVVRGGAEALIPPGPTASSVPEENGGTSEERRRVCRVSILTAGKVLKRGWAVPFGPRSLPRWRPRLALANTIARPTGCATSSSVARMGWSTSSASSSG